MAVSSTPSNPVANDRTPESSKRDLQFRRSLTTELSADVSFDLLLSLPIFDSTSHSDQTFEAISVAQNTGLQDASEGLGHANDENTESKQEQDEATVASEVITSPFGKYIPPFVQESKSSNNQKSVSEGNQVLDQVADASPTFEDSRSSDLSQKARLDSPYPLATKKSIVDSKPNQGATDSKLDPYTNTDNKLLSTDAANSNKTNQLMESQRLIFDRGQRKPGTTEKSNGVDANKVDHTKTTDKLLGRTIKNESESSPKLRQRFSSSPTDRSSPNENRLNRRAERLLQKQERSFEDSTGKVSADQSQSNIDSVVLFESSIVSNVSEISLTSPAIAPEFSAATQVYSSLPSTLSTATSVANANDSVSVAFAAATQNRVIVPKTDPTLTAMVGISPGVPSEVNTSGVASQSSTVSGGSRTGLSNYQEQRVLQRVLRGINQLGNGNGQVRLRLHPPELGSLQLTLRVDSYQVAALIEVETTAARDTLANNLPQLQSRLSEQGLVIQQLDIQVVDSEAWSQNASFTNRDQDQPSGSTSDNSRNSRNQRERLGNRIEPIQAFETLSATRTNLTRTQGQLDKFV